MSLRGNKGEWSEVYTLLKLLGEGEIYGADDKLEKVTDLVYPILNILRQEKDSKREYHINGSIKLLDGDSKDIIKEFDKSKFLEYSQKIFSNLKKLSGRSIKIEKFENYEEIQSFLNDINVKSLKAKSLDKADIIITIHDKQTGTAPTLGFSIKSLIGGKSTLFNPAPGTNFIFEIVVPDKTGFDEKSFNKLTYTESPRLGKRIQKIEDLGFNIQFDSIQSNTLDLNLKLIDGDLSKILAYMLLYRHKYGKIKLTDVLNLLNKYNPLGYDLSRGHPFYEYKIIKFLYDIALGMTPECIWTGEIKANGGVIVVKDNGEVLAYHTYYKDKFEKYLLENTKLEEPSTGEDPEKPGNPREGAKKYYYGWVYEESNRFFIKLNLQVRFIK
ncbi:HpaII family restriction endonuclease [Sulfurimonas marina]|uniref:HpaII family restriction endonuclease n=1 Tax=Sulfurimonas marina TaxID=2590551 RepID=A0A7M1AUG3_9BACT|nr:HpaII family restriction endonuclease [Sulfurimonas marina]QOP41050.1 HpaII family restriction endonuclease [Sulfurimonas marina]